MLPFLPGNTGQLAWFCSSVLTYIVLLKVTQGYSVNFVGLWNQVFRVVVHHFSHCTILWRPRPLYLWKPTDLLGTQFWGCYRGRWEAGNFTPASTARLALDRIWHSFVFNLNTNLYVLMFEFLLHSFLFFPPLRFLWTIIPKIYLKHNCCFFSSLKLF